MILVVTQVLYEERQVPPASGSDEEIRGVNQTEMVAVALELSDGWYRIKSNLDDALYRAVWFGHIYSGMKIQLQGAKVGNNFGCASLFTS